MKKYIIEKEYKGYEVSQYLKEVHGYSSRGLRTADIYINSKKVRLDKKLRPKDNLKVYEQEKEIRMEAVEVPLNIVYEDEELIIINKQPYLITHPTLKKSETSLASGIVYHYRQKGIEMVPRFYNRLDMNTSGLIIAAKTGHAQAFLQNHGELKKYYLAAVKGIVEKDEFIIEKKIGISEDGIKREISPTGQEAKTAVKVLGRDLKANVSFVELELFTGRTHQIRVHLSSEGHPILGDELYGGKDIRAKRQMLHSYKVEFTHPSTKERKLIEIEMADDMKAVINESGNLNNSTDS